MKIAGVDEVGRGPLAGPVLAAAVILDVDSPMTGLRDSKKLSEKKRIALSAEIKNHAIAWAIGMASVKEIDQINILNASLLAMQRAVAHLPIVPDKVLVDGNKAPKFSMPVSAIIGGDDLFAEISAASIIAKVARDRLMCLFDKRYPNYGFSQHKGYGTKSHMAAIKAFGITPLHRRSFAPVRQCIVA